MAETLVKFPSPPITRDKLLAYLNTYGYYEQLSPQETEQFIALALEFQLNPYKREIHCILGGEGLSRRVSMVIGYETYIKRAEETSKLDGWRAWTIGSGEALKALVEIHRKDWTQAFVHEVPWSEAVQKNSDGSLAAFWKKMPSFQLKKVAISQAFRLAFPEALGGMPYSSDELGLFVSQEAETSKLNGEASTQAPNGNIQIGYPLRQEPQEQGNSRDSYQTESQALEALLELDAPSITPQLKAWIRAQVAKNPTLSQVQKMLHYSKKLLRDTEAKPTLKSWSSQGPRKNYQYSKNS